jgi:uncharacterized protein Usg
MLPLKRKRHDARKVLFLVDIPREFWHDIPYYETEVCMDYFQMRAIELRMLRYRLTMAEITYHLPDHPALLQSFIWQDLDIAPAFPVLNRFLDFWQHNLDGRLHSVTVTAATLTKPAEFRYADTVLTLH